MPFGERQEILFVFPICMIFLTTKFLTTSLALVLAVLSSRVQAQAVSIQLTPSGNATLSWNASATGPVNVQWSGNLSTWSVVSAGNSNGTFSHPTGNATKSFYRLQSTFAPDSMVLVAGNNSTISNLLFSNTETTWGEWKRVRAWAVGNGYDIGGVGNSTADDNRQPVHSVSWYDAVKWCNAKSEMEGWVPVYRLAGNLTYKSGQHVPAPLANANGYRLPTEAEWAWAAGGGVRSQSYIYSGSNNAGAVAWYSDNSDGGPKPVGTKSANELVLFDMSGNVFEWCWNIQFDNTRGLRGGAWAATEDQCAISAEFEEYPNTGSTEIGFRVVRTAGN